MTTVTAQAPLKDSSGAPANGLDSGTAVCSWGAGRLDVFAKGTNGNLWHKWWSGSWSSWEDLSAPTGGLFSAPTAVSWGAGRIDVFARGGDGDLIHKWFDNGWHDWESLGLPFVGYMHGGPVVTNIAWDTAPAACSWGAGRLDVFVMGQDQSLHHLWFDNGWKAWDGLGSPSPNTGIFLGGSPGALSTISWGYPRVDIFVRGTDGALWQLWWKNGWQPWHRFDDTVGHVPYSPDSTEPPGLPDGYYGTYLYAPAVCSWGANRLDVFFVDTSGHLQQKWFDSSVGGWQPLYNVGGTKYISGAPSAIVWQLGGTTRIDIFARSDLFALPQLYFAGGWNGWYNLGLM